MAEESDEMWHYRQGEEEEERMDYVERLNEIQKLKKSLPPCPFCKCTDPGYHFKHCRFARVT